jgi:hypothetical protein
MDAEAEAESAMDPPVEPEPLPAGHAGDAAVAGSVDRSSRAVRMLRSIAGWTTLTEHDEPDRRPGNP